MSFIIEINGKDITTLEDIRENFNIDILLEHRENFDVWLAGWDYEDEAAQVRDLPPDLSDDDWLKKVCKIIGIPSSTLTATKRKRTLDAKKAEKAKAAEEEKKKQREADKQRTTSIPITRDNIAIEIIEETIQSPPGDWSIAPRLKFIKNDIYLFDHWGSRIINSTDRGQTWQCSDIFFPGETYNLGGRWVSVFNGCTFTKENEHFMVSEDGCEWEVKYLGNVSGGLRKILFDGEQYILITQNRYETGTIFKETHYYYNFYSSNDLKTWSKIGELPGFFRDICFIDGYYYLLDATVGSSHSYYQKAKTVQELLAKNTKKISEKEYSDLSSYSNGRIILGKRNGFALIRNSDNLDMGNYSGVAIFVEGLVFCCEENGDILVSENGIKNTWRKIGKTPFTVEYLAYQNNYVVISGHEFGNYDNMKVCVAKVYAKEENTDNQNLKW